MLYGKSGYGKSSLLNAGILPRLKAENDNEKAPKRYLPIPVRFQAAEGAGEGLMDKFRFHFGRAAQALKYSNAQILKNTPLPDTLWGLFKTINPPENTAFVLLFDQFEEFFSYPTAQQEAFKEQLSELLYTTYPAFVRENRKKLSDAAYDFLSRDLDVRAVFAIRADRLSDLDRLSRPLSAILKNRMELGALSEAQAEEAILRPAALPNDQGLFKTQPFHFSDEALRRIKAELVGKDSKRIESFVLQIVCFSIEKTAERGGLTEITPQQLPDFDEVFDTYYREQLAELPAAEREQAAHLLEYALLGLNAQTGEAHRRSVDSADLAAAPALLDALESTYLIRREINSFGRFSYEISHDTLLEPVLKARLAKDAAEAEQKRLAEEAAERERLRAEAEAQRLEREKISRARRRNALFSALAALLLGWALWQTWQAGKRSEEAQAAENKAKLAQNDADAAKTEALKAQEEAKAQKRIAELEKNNARTKEEEAELATLRAKEQQRLAQKAGTSAVKSILEQARLDVLKLDYAAALKKLTSAADIGQMPDSVGLALMEIAFFHTETDSLFRARRIAAAVGTLLGKKINTSGYTQQQLRDALRGLAPERYEVLERRYYPDMVLVKGGICPFGKGEGRDTVAAPVADFKMARTETTFWQYGLFCAHKQRNVRDFSPGWGIDGDNPVVNVNWYDAVEYANWLSIQRGLTPAYTIDSLTQDPNNKSNNDDIKWTVTPVPGANGYRLPTETEWEYAARGGDPGDGTIYSGSNKLNEVAWNAVDGGNSTIGGVRRSRPVQKLKPNRLGLHDMSGNLWEWCWDWYGDYPAALPRGYAGPNEGRGRCLRGGAWLDYYGYYFRVGYRSFNNADGRNSDLGFRLSQD